MRVQFLDLYNMMYFSSYCHYDHQVSPLNKEIKKYTKKNLAMTKILSSKYVVLILSVALNGYLMMNMRKGDGSSLSWSIKAAQEAEEVATLNCSGHGRAYLDGLIVDGRPLCECYACFVGPDCSAFSPDCPADADSGNPIFMEPFWRKNAANSAVLVSGWHRMGYTYDDHSYISQELKIQIQKLHTDVGNAVTSGKFIIFGAGSTQLLNAAVHALSPENSAVPSRVVASSPCYPMYKFQTDFFNSVDYKFQGDTSLWKNNTDPSINFIEFVTSPNNPDGQMKKAALHRKSVKTIYDHAYYWPHFSAIPVQSDEDVMLFTISKLTGHASSRFGWALIKDEAVYNKMIMYLTVNTMGVSRDTQLRTLKLLQVVLQGDRSEIFKFGYITMNDRWKKLTNALSGSKHFSIQEIAPQYCNFFKKVRGPSPAYAWFKCEREEDTNCSKVLKAANIIGRDGNIFGGDNRYVRLSLLKSQDDFDLLLQKINKLVSMEDGAKIM